MIKETLVSGWEHFRGSLGGIWEVWRKDKLKNHYNVPWEKVELPHCFNAFDAVDPDVTYYQGQGWYRSLLTVNNPYQGGRTLLHFQGVGQRAKVFVYTEEVGSHIGGYDEFVIDITEAVEKARTIERYQGKIPVAVMSDNSRDLETIPSDISDFNLYGGIYREVSLVYVPALSLERVHIQSDVTCDNASIAVTARLYNPEMLAEPMDIIITVNDTYGNVIECTELNNIMPWTDEKKLLSMEIKKPVLWSPDNPGLYRCIVKVSTGRGVTEYSENFGLRFFEFRKKGPFFINGERLLLRGTHRHDDLAGVGAAMTDEMVRTEMMLIKEMGVNFIRLGHYQQSRTVLSLCDKLGIFVWEEIPWCRGGLGGVAYRQQCKDMLSNMIDQHYNHPSTLLWGLGNENDWEGDFDYFDKEEIRSFMSDLNRLAHTLDSNRVTSIRRCDFCRDIVDVYSPTIWPGWYSGIYLNYEDFTRKGFESTDRFFHAEWGADSLAGRHAEKPYTGFQKISNDGSSDSQDSTIKIEDGFTSVARKGDWSETYFCDLIDWYLKSQENMDWLTGTAQWTFKDFSTPGRPDSPIPYMNLKGVVQRDLTKKEAYYVFQSYWTTQPMVHIYGQNEGVRWGKEESKCVRVYSNCDEAELYLNGASCGRKKRDPQDFPCAGLRWNLSFKPGLNVINVKAKKSNVQVFDEKSIYYQTEQWGAPAFLKFTAKQKEKDLFYIEAKAYDENYIFCPDASQVVRFGAAGEGKLLDNLGTVKGSRVIQLADGKAGIYVKVYGKFAVATVTADNLKGDYIYIGKK